MPPSHTVARIGGLLDHHHHNHQHPHPQTQQTQQQQQFNVVVAPPPLQQQNVPTATAAVTAAQPSSMDLASTVDLTADSRTPIDYLTPPPNSEFTFQNFQPAAELQPLQAAAIRSETQAQQLQPTAFAQQSQIVQTSSPSNQMPSLSYVNQPPEQFAPASQQGQPPPQNAAGRWELGFDASDILTPPFAGGTEQPGGQFFQQEIGVQDAAAVGPQRNNKQFLANGGGGQFDAAVAANNNKFTPLDAIVRASPYNNNNNNNVYWGKPKTAQQQPLRPAASFAEPNAYRFNNGFNHGHHPQFVDTFQMPFTGQFDGPLSQGTVADHVVHSSFRVKRQTARRPSPSTLYGIRKRADEDVDMADERKPVFSYVKTDKNGNFKWGVRHGY